MNTLSIDLEYCFGIGKFKHDFDFEAKQSNTFLIYAPNGTMKTSFAKTLDLIAKNEPKNMPRDRVYVDRQSRYDVLVDGEPILPGNILVINAENETFDASSKLSSFIASKDLKERYDSIYKDLEYQKTEFIKKLKIVSQSTDCEGEIMGAFSESIRDSFFDVIVTASKSLLDKCDKYEFKYNDIFDKKENVKKFLDKNEAVLDQYMSDYKVLITNSKFFKETDGKSFGTYQASELLKSIEDNSFFEAGHKFVLEDGTEITDSQALKDVVKTEIDKIVNDVKLKASFEKVDKAIASNVELRAFKRAIERDNLLLVELKNYDAFKKKVWVSFLSELKSDTELLVGFYLSKKAELEQIIEEAKREVELWKQIITTFNSRFYVPFKVGLTNQEDVILKQQTANLEFHYFDGVEPPVLKGRQDLLDVLSRGERRAYFILQFLFEIESRKNSGIKNLLIFDDVADSFDYKNKYAIIEYIRDLRESDKFKMILLTHNFDFYRTIIARLYLYQPHCSYYIATKNSNKDIYLSEGFNTKNVFEDFVKEIDQPKAFVSCIAFVRNIIEFSDSRKCDDYKLLTNSLHLKEASKTIKALDVFSVFQGRLTGVTDKTISFAEENIVDLIGTTADSILAEENPSEVDLYNKIVLAIAIRIEAERYLLSKLPEAKEKDHPNPTNYLYNKYRGKYPDSSNLGVLDRVNLMTPENIHINAFMYEPLVDMSFYHLCDLYTDIKALV
ncbi:ATP-binding protein [Sphingobacterium wenxiniae]|uniref:AAA domain-containing protein n=1 Tax=Sphingobacterium wenxiniae TaxID=683125 RepID=A0A1I6TH58_9SPHI|nr:hypothetical protein [Sphingobacterium wenxiniae]SFS88534.1 hypothetical protein SAMN05660206_106148 [Sphingobacterium wenxiniae]